MYGGNDMRNFKWLTGDIDYATYGGKWYRVPNPNLPHRAHIMELLNWNEYEWNPVIMYSVTLSEVDLNEIPIENIKAAKECYGIDVDEVISFEFLLETLHGFGGSAPIYEESGNNYRNLLRAARNESRRLEDPEVHRAAMNKVVNKIGSTAYEYMRGDLFSAMERNKTEPHVKIIRKIYGMET
jgi:hypothetical protein